MNAKHILSSKTLWVNFFVILAAVADLADVVQLSFMSEEYWAFTVGIINIFLRFLTGQPVQVRKPE